MLPVYKTLAYSYIYHIAPHTYDVNLLLKHNWQRRLKNNKFSLSSLCMYYTTFCVLVSVDYNSVLTVYW